MLIKIRQDSMKTLDTHNDKIKKIMSRYWMCFKDTVVKLNLCQLSHHGRSLKFLRRQSDIFHFHILFSQSLLRAVTIVPAPNHRKHQEVVGSIHFLSHFP